MERYFGRLIKKNLANEIVPDLSESALQLLDGRARLEVLIMLMRQRLERAKKEKRSYVGFSIEKGDSDHSKELYREILDS